MNEAQTINVQLIDRPVPPVRTQFNEDEIAALTESIREQGILVPLLVRRTGERYEVIDGDCRLEAACRLRLREVPCMVRDATDRETHVLRMLANLERNDPDPVSEAIYIAKAITSGILTAEDFAQKLKRSIEWVENRLAIATMPDYMQELLRSKQLGLGVALHLVQIDDDSVRERWTYSAVRDGMTERGARESLKQFRDIKEMQQQAEPGAAAPAIPEAPPVILWPCVRCGQNAESNALRFVRIHIQDCPTE